MRLVSFIPHDTVSKGTISIQIIVALLYIICNTVVALVVMVVSCIFVADVNIILILNNSNRDNMAWLIS